MLTKLKASVFQCLFFLRHLRQSLLSTHHLKSLILPQLCCFAADSGGARGGPDDGQQLQQLQQRKIEKELLLLEQKLQLNQERHTLEQGRLKLEHEQRLRVLTSEADRHIKKLDEETGEVMFDN